MPTPSPSNFKPRFNRMQELLLAGVMTTLVIGGFLTLYSLDVPFLGKPAPTSVVVYTSLPLQLSTGRTISNGIRLAFEEHEYKSGNANVQLVVKDDGDQEGAWVPEIEKTNAELASADPKVVAYIGTFNSGAAKISMPILNNAGILQVSPGNTWPGLTKAGFLPGEPGIFYPTGGRHYFRVCTTDDLQGPAGALWAKDLGFKTVYIVDDGDVYGKGIAYIFSNKATALGLTVLSHVELDQAADTFDASMKALVADIIAKKADLIYYGGITPNGGPELLATLRKAGSKQAFMGPDGILEQDFIDRTGPEYAEGVYATTIGVPPLEIGNDAAKVFYEKYKKRFNEEPTVFSAFGYEAANVTLQAIANAPEKTRALVLQEIRTLRSWSGVLGTWSFNENGDTSATLLSGNIVRNGRFEYVKKLAVP